MERFVEIRGAIPESDEDALAESLSDRPVLGVQIEPRSPGVVDVSVWVSEGDDEMIHVVRAVLADLGSREVELATHAAEDWSARWRDGLAPFEVGRRWWIDPRPGLNIDPPDGRVGISLVPRAAFGSGTHESTQLVLLHLEQIDCRVASVLDIGTGSGVLAVAASLLGARHVMALDIDPVAAWEAARTAAIQPTHCPIRVLAGTVGCIGDATFDLVLCNMIVSEFRPILGEIRRILAPSGEVILSGILGCERQSVEDLLTAHRMAATSVIELGEWIGVRAAPGSAV